MSVYDQVEIEDMVWDRETELFLYPCPCGDRFAIHILDLKDGEDIAICPLCLLTIQVVFDQDDLQIYLDELEQ